MARSELSNPTIDALLIIRLYPFNEGSHVLPKALFPVGNTPMIDIVLQWVLAAGILGESLGVNPRLTTDILVIAPETTHERLSEHLAQHVANSSLPHARISLKQPSDGEEEANGHAGPSRRLTQKEGTAALLRRFRNHIKVNRDWALNTPC